MSPCRSVLATTASVLSLVIALAIARGGAVVAAPSPFSSSPPAAAAQTATFTAACSVPEWCGTAALLQQGVALFFDILPSRVVNVSVAVGASNSSDEGSQQLVWTITDVNVSASATDTTARHTTAEVIQLATNTYAAAVLEANLGIVNATLMVCTEQPLPGGGVPNGTAVPCGAPSPPSIAADAITANPFNDWDAADPTAAVVSLPAGTSNVTLSLTPSRCVAFAWLTASLALTLRLTTLNGSVSLSPPTNVAPCGAGSSAVNSANGTALQVTASGTLGAQWVLTCPSPSPTVIAGSASITAAWCTGLLADVAAVLPAAQGSLTTALGGVATATITATNIPPAQTASNGAAPAVTPKGLRYLLAPTNGATNVAAAWNALTGGQAVALQSGQAFVPLKRTASTVTFGSFPGPIVSSGTLPLGASCDALFATSAEVGATTTPMTDDAAAKFPLLWICAGIAAVCCSAAALCVARRRPLPLKWHSDMGGTDLGQLSGDDDHLGEPLRGSGTSAADVS